MGPEESALMLGGALLSSMGIPKEEVRTYSYICVHIYDVNIIYTLYIYRQMDRYG